MRVLSGTGLLLMATCSGAVAAAPVISPISSQSANEDTVIGPIAFTIGHATTPAAQLRLSATSSIPGLFPPGSIVFGGSDSNRTVTLRPATNGFGNATVNITVSNATEFASRAFQAAIIPVNDPPTLDPVPDQAVDVSGGGAPVFLSGITPGAVNEFQNLTVTVVSNSNPALFDSQPGITYSSPASSALLSFRPLFNTMGEATLVVQVNDGAGSNNIVRRQFRVAVTNDLVDLSVLVASAFPYPAGVSNILTYSFRVQNNGFKEATNVVFTSALPTNLVFQSAQIGGMPGACSHAGGVVTCQFPSVPAFRSSFIRLRLLPVADGAASTSVSVASPHWERYPADNSTMITTPVIRTADLALSESGFPDAVLVGSNLTYTLQVTNQGVISGTNTRVAVYFSENMRFLSIVTSQGSCSNGLTDAACALGNFAPGDSARITVTIRPQSAGETYVAASASSDTPEVQHQNNNVYNYPAVTRTIAQAASTAAIQIPVLGAAAPYPSTLHVSGLTTRVQRVSVTLHGLTHPTPGDLDVMLVGPTGRSMLLFSNLDVSEGATNVTLTLDDPYSPVASGEVLVSGRYAPTDFDDSDMDLDLFPPPAPSRPSVSFGLLDVFRDSDGNGTWSLYIVDDSPGGGGGVLAGGWSLTISAGNRSLAEPATFRALATAGPSGAGGGSFLDIGSPVLNAAGQVAFHGATEIFFPGGGTDSSVGVWTASTPQDLRKLVGNSDTPPGQDTNWQFQIGFDFESAPALNDAGLISFGARVYDQLNGFEYFGIWSGASSNDLENLVLTGGRIPGMGENSIFAGLSRPYLNDSGVIAFRGHGDDTVSGESFSGFWLGTSRSNLSLLAVSGRPAPGVDGNFSEIFETDFMPPVLDTTGRLAFLAEAQTDFDSVPGIWVGTSAQDLRPVALGGLTIPGLPSDLALTRDARSWRLLGFDSAGRVYFRTEVFGDFSPSFTGIFAGTGPADLQLLFSTDTPYFAGSTRVSFHSFECPEVTPDGGVIFLAEFEDADQGNVVGLWKGRGAGDLKLVAYDGQRLPGVSETAVLRDLGLNCPARGINRFGRFVFQAGIEEPQLGFNSTWFVHDPVAGLVPLVRLGDLIELAPGDFRRLIDVQIAVNLIDSSMDKSGGRRVFNDAGEFAFRAYFEDNTTAIVVAQLGSASVEGEVWYDRAANAVQDTGEPGVPQTRVDLFSPGADGQPGGDDDVLVASRLTDGNGHYRLGTMTAGQYFLQFTPPAGFGFVAPDQGGNDARDSDADPATGRTALFTLGTTTRDTTQSAGLVSGFAVVDSTVTEGDTGMKEMIVTVALGVPRRFPVSVNYATASGTAMSDVDFTTVVGTLTFNPGEATKTFSVLVQGDTLPENDETVLINLGNPVGAPVVRAQGVGRILNDDPVPAVPSQPRPLHHSVLQPLNVDLSWKSGRSRELLTNGGFELGSFAGWTVEPAATPYGGFFPVEDSLDAPEGRFYATSSIDAAEPRILSRRLLLPDQLVSARLRWWQRLSFSGGSEGNPRFRVEVRDEARQTLAVIYQAGADNDIFDWEQVSADLRPFGGRMIEIAFIVESPRFSLHAALDAIRVEVDDTAGTVFDVYLGTRAIPGAAEFRGTTPQTFWPATLLAPLTTYYWQVVARRGDASVAGPVWQFTTRRDVTNDFAYTFSSLDEILVPYFGDDGRAWPYPSTITVRNLPGAIAKATVTLHGLSHSYPEDLDILLVAPDGRHALLMSDAGGSNAVSGLTLTFDDAATSPIPQAGPLRSGTFRPANYAVWPDAFPPSAPVGPYSASLSRFGESNPNGNWSLYVFDGFSFEDGGAIADGWSLSLTLLQADSDNDGLPDDYEITHDLNPLNSLDARSDFDEDGHTLAQEYAAGTNPDDPGSILRIRRFHFEGDDAVLEISTGVNRDYRIERLTSVTGPGVVFAELPGGDDWSTVRDFGARRLPRAFYRVRAVPSAAPFDPEFPPGFEYFRAQITPLTNTSFTRLFTVFDDAVSQEVVASRPSSDMLTIEGRAGNSGNGFFAERFQITLPGAVAPGQFTIAPGSPAFAAYGPPLVQWPPVIIYSNNRPDDGGVVAIDTLTNSFASGRFTLDLSDTSDTSRRIRATGSFRVFIE